MIGKIILKDGNEIVLTDLGSIESSSGLLVRLVESELSLYRSQYSPANGAFGVDFLHELAEKLGGKVEIEKKKAPPQDAIF